MTNLIQVTPVQQDNVVIYVCNETKQPYFNLAQARIIFPNVPDKTLRRRLEGVSKSEVKTAEVLTNGGLQGVSLYSVEVLVNLAFEFDLTLAKLITQAGAAVYLYGLAGYEVKPVVKTPCNLIEALELALVQAKEIEKLKMINESLEDDNLRQSEIIDELFDHSSIVRIAKYNNVSETSFNWRLLKSASGKMGIEIKKAPCPRYGEKNLYSHDAWRLAYPEYRLPETTTLRIG
jgi:hypothetical protein